MKGSRFSEEQIIGVLREHEAGAKTEEGKRGTNSISNVQRPIAKKVVGGTDRYVN